MLSEFECGTCQAKFVVAFMQVRPGFPIQHCVACGSEDLKWLSSRDDDVALYEACKGLLEIAELAMPGSYFQSDSRVQDAKQAITKYNELIQQMAIKPEQEPTLKELVGELEKIEDELDRMPSEMSGFARSGTLHERRLNLLSAIVKRVVAEELHELK